MDNHDTTNLTNIICQTTPAGHRILIVDDDEWVRDILLQTIQRLGHECQGVADGLQALETLSRNQFDVVITDVSMPNLDGVSLLKQIKNKYDTDVIVMTGDPGDISYEGIIGIGASDFFLKPAPPGEIATRLARVLKERCLKATSVKAHQKLQEAHAQLQASYMDTIHRLVLAAEYKDEDTGDHIIRIGRYCALMAQKLGMHRQWVRQIEYASPMHDIGKIGIPDQILLKPGRLTAEEFDIIKTHTTIGGRILSGSKSEIIQLARQIALTHHEKWDGTGYPQGLGGTDIPLAGRLVAIVDTFDALTSKRPYKSAYPVEIAIDIMKGQRGKQFDPSLLDLFLTHLPEVLEIKKAVGPDKAQSLETFIPSDRDLRDETMILPATMEPAAMHP